MVACSFAQAVVMANRNLVKASTAKIAQVFGEDGSIQNIHGLHELYPKHLLSKNDAYYEEMINLLVWAGRGHYKLYQSGATPILCPILPLTSEVEMKAPVRVKLLKLEVKVEPLWLLYAIDQLKKEVEGILVDRGVCMDLRKMLAGGNVLCLYGSDQVGLGRSLDKILLCLSKILLINNHSGLLGVPGLNTPHGFLLHERHFANERMPGCVRIIQPQDSRDLLCGKKDGKINRIQRENNCRITVRDGEQDKKYFWIFLEPSGIGKALLAEALRDMKRELPAELCFHLDDQYHKSLIGVGGSNIQRVMKQHGVYVRFLGSGEAAHVLGGDEREWPGAPLANVLIRTPQRNHAALMAMKADLFTIAGEDIPTLHQLPLREEGGWIVRKGGELVKIKLLGQGEELPSIQNTSFEEMEKLIKEIPEDISLLSSDNRLRSPLPEPNYSGSAYIPDSSNSISNFKSYLPVEWIQHDPLYLIRPRSKSHSNPLLVNKNIQIGIIGEGRRRSSL